MGLNLSNQQIAQELELNQADVHEMTTFLRQALHAQRQPPVLEGRSSLMRFILSLVTKDNQPRSRPQDAPVGEID